MRIGKFESGNLTPLGQGDEKKVFVNPDNESRVITERKEDAITETESPRQLKGRYYLTKITHMLLPEQIPDIYQAGETKDGTQSTDRERLPLTKGQEILQEARNSGADETEAKKIIEKELMGDVSKLTEKLEELGLGFNIDENLGNYTRNEQGTLNYFETFNPWQSDSTSPGGIELLFDEETMKEAIEQMPDGSDKKMCEGYMERLLELAEEEKQAIQQKADEKIPLSEGSPEVSNLNALFLSFELKYPLEALHAITTKEEALASEERELARKALGPILTTLNSLINGGLISSELYGELHDRYKKLDRAVGMMGKNGLIDHTR